MEVFPGKAAVVPDTAVADSMVAAPVPTAAAVVEATAAAVVEAMVGAAGEEEGVDMAGAVGAVGMGDDTGFGPQLCEPQQRP